MSTVLMDVLAAFAIPLPQDVIGIRVAPHLIHITGQMIPAAVLGACLNVLKEGVAVTQTHGAVWIAVACRRQIVLAEKCLIVAMLLLPCCVMT